MLRIAIASRIFAPEPSAATFRLTALTRALLRGGHHVHVRTVRAPKHHAAESRAAERELIRTGTGTGTGGLRISRFAVLRDTSGYVRGYLPYMSFDVPLFFRILFGRRADVHVVEPPPTTGVFVRAAAALRRTPYVYYAADIWSDAASQTGAPQIVTRTVRQLERWALNGAAQVIAVSDGVNKRLSELGISAPVTTVGNGVDVAQFSYTGERVATDGPLFVYAGTASEWHGAEVFVRAFAEVVRHEPRARLVFIGGGAERQRLANLADELNVRIELLGSMQPIELATWLRAATASLASVRPGVGYDFAFPTKLYSSAAAGTPLVYAGIGPGSEFVRTELDSTPIGTSCDYDAQQVSQAMQALIEQPVSAERRAQVSEWAHDAVSIDRVAARIRTAIEAVAQGVS